MIFINHITEKIRKLSIPRSADPDIALREYMTGVALLVLVVVSGCLLIVSAGGWLTGAIPADTVLIVFLMTASFLLSLPLSRTRCRRITSAKPPAIIFCSALYGNYIGGMDAPAMLLYPLAIVLSALLQGLSVMYFTACLSLIAFTSLALAHHQGWIVAMRTSETAFINRIAIVITTIAGISLLIRMFIIFFREALNDSRKHFTEARELATSNSLLYEKARQEIADRKMTEDQLRASESKYRELVQNANSIIMRLNTKGEIIFFNEFAQRLFGYTVDEVLGHKVMGLIVPDIDSDGKNQKTMIDGMLINPMLHGSSENENITRDGHRLWIAWANRPIYDPNGSLREVLCVGNDITERKRAQEEREKIQAQLIQAQKMEAIGTLTSGLAHDFNNLLGGILGSLSIMHLLLDEDNPPDRDLLNEYIHTAMESSERAADMIQRLLSISRRQDITLVPVDIRMSIRNVAAVCANSLPKSITIDLCYPDNTIMVMADPSMIEQALLNLMVNASHAMTSMLPPEHKQGGVLRVHAEPASYNDPATSDDLHLKKGQYIRITVTDTGVGIGKEVLKKIFEPFFTTKKRGEGSGLGLAMVYNIIQQFNGHITVDSEPGKGTTFTIYLPAAESQHQETAGGDSGSVIKKGNGTILIVDDEPMILKVASGILRVSGYTVLTADSGMSGLVIFRQRHSGITGVLLDMTMPDMSGIEVLDYMKRIDNTATIILSSGFTLDSSIKKMITERHVHFIEKPYTAGQLSAFLNQVLGSKPAIRES